MVVRFVRGQGQCGDIVAHEFEGCLGALRDVNAQVESDTQKVTINLILGATACEAEDHHGIRIVASIFDIGAGLQ